MDSNLYPEAKMCKRHSSFWVVAFRLNLHSQEVVNGMSLVNIVLLQVPLEPQGHRALVVV